MSAMHYSPILPLECDVQQSNVESRKVTLERENVFRSKMSEKLVVRTRFNSCALYALLKQLRSNDSVGVIV